MNITEDVMAFIGWIGITIDYGNYPAPYKIPLQQQQQGWEQKGGEVWKSLGIIWPLEAKNDQYYFTWFQKYMKEEVPNMRKLELFLVLFPVGYLNTTIIPEIFF